MRIKEPEGRAQSQEKDDVHSLEISGFSEIFFIFGVIQKLEEKYEKNGYFLLPSSKENLELNLKRLTGNPTLIIRKMLDEFLIIYKNKLEILKNEFTYGTGYNYYPHKSQRNKCHRNLDELRESEESITLRGKLTELAEGAYKRYQPNHEETYYELIEKIATVKDLIFLLLLKHVSKGNYYGYPVPVEYSEGKHFPSSDLKESLKELEINEKILHRLFSYEGKFCDLFKELKEYLPIDAHSFIVLNAHLFNSSTCILEKCLYMHEYLAEFLHKKLKGLPIEELMHKTYSSNVSKFEEKYGRPLFDYKDKKLQLLSKILPELKHRKMFVFSIEEYEKELEELRNKKMLEVVNDEIKVNDWERLDSYYHALLDKERRLLEVIVSRFVKVWLFTKVKLETLPEELPKLKPEDRTRQKKPKIADQETINIRRLIENEENEKVEFKSSMCWDYKKNQKNKLMEFTIAKTVSAFMNSEGGFLLIGIGDDKQTLGLDKDFAVIKKPNKDAYKLHFTSVINKYLGKENRPHAKIWFETLDGKIIAVVRVDKSPNPVYIKSEGEEEFYIRLGNSSHPFNVREATTYIKNHW